MKDYNDNVENDLLDKINQKEEMDKKLLRLEIIIGLATLIMYLTLVIIVSYTEIQEGIKSLIIISLTIYLVIICFILLKIEQIAGYYECRKCHHRYVPTYSNVLWAMHIHRTRYMRCPKCHEKSWQKKVITK